MRAALLRIGIRLEAGYQPHFNHLDGELPEYHAALDCFAIRLSFQVVVKSR